MVKHWLDKKGHFEEALNEYVVIGSRESETKPKRYHFDYAGLFLVKRSELRGAELQSLVLMQRERGIDIDDQTRDNIDSLLSLGKYASESSIWRVYLDLSKRTEGMTMGNLKRLVIDPANGAIYLSLIDATFLLLTCTRSESDVPYMDAFHHALVRRITAIVKAPTDPARAPAQPIPSDKPAGAVAAKPVNSRPAKGAPPRKL